MRLAPWIFTAMLLTGGTLFAQPKLAIPANRFEFGFVPQNSTVSHFFWFKSVGTDTVRIREVKTGCDCTTIPLERDWIAPGDSMQVGVYWEPETKGGISGRYPYIYIDGQEEAERLYLLAEVASSPDALRPLSFKPFRAELSRMTGMTVDSVNVKVTNHSDRVVRLKVVSEPIQECTVKTIDSLPPNGTGIISIAVGPGFKETEFIRSITLAFDGGVPNVQGKFTIPIRRKVIS